MIMMMMVMMTTTTTKRLKRPTLTLPVANFIILNVSAVVYCACDFIQFFYSLIIAKREDSFRLVVNR